MLISMLKSKIHRATVTEADLHYVGSLTLDQDLIEAAGMLPYERIQVLNVNNAERFETYIIEGERGSGVVCLNGPAARLGVRGDIIIALTYCQMEPEEARGHVARTVHVDEHNRITSVEPCHESD